MAVYPTLGRANRILNTVHVMNHTLLPLTDTTAPLDLATLDAASQAAAAAFVAAGTAANTVRSYRSALAYWAAWLHGRYGHMLGDAPLPPTVVVQFVLDHLARPTDAGGWAHTLPPMLDAALVDAGVKGQPVRWRSIP